MAEHWEWRIHSFLDASRRHGLESLIKEGWIPVSLTTSNGHGGRVFHVLAKRLAR